MTTDFANDHAAGLHQDEIVALMNKIEPCLYGHSRAIVLMTMIRIVAVMLGPAKPETREAQLREIPIAIRSILNEMDRLMEQQR